MSDDTPMILHAMPAFDDGCPVWAELFGANIGVCGDPITHEVAFTCDGGCVREPRQVCGFHALLLSKDDESAYCGKCETHRIRPAGVRVLSENNGGDN